MSVLRFDSLGIRRMPGIRDGYVLDDLSPGLNIVHGPNASGKTTTSRSLEALLWPGAAPNRAWLTGSFRLAGDTWRVELDSGQARYQREGREASPPLLPPAETRDRYRLSLHELLAADDAGFAQAVMRESAGGYDLAAAASMLNPRTAASRCTREIAALRKARERLEEARRRQEELFSDERRLRELEERTNRLGVLRQQVRLLERAVEHAEARDAAEEAERVAGGFPLAMERVRGNEAEELDSLEASLREARLEYETTLREYQRAEATLRDGPIPREGLPEALLPSLRAKLANLRELEREVASREQHLAGARSRRTRERERLSGEIDEARLAKLSLDGLQELIEFAQAAEEVQAERTEADTQLRWLEPTGAPADRQELERGVLILRQWLHSAGPTESEAPRLRRLGRAASALVVVLGLLLGLLSPWLALVALSGVGLLMQFLRRQPEVDLREVHRAEFEKLPLHPPEDWQAEAVSGRLSMLEKELAEAVLNDERARRREDVRRRLQALQEREREIAAERERYTARLGVDPATSVGKLVWLVQRIAQWQEADTEVVGITAELSVAREQFARELGSAADRLRTVGCEEVNDTRDLAGALERLEQHARTHQEALQSLQRARERGESARRQAEKLNAARKEIFERLGLPVGDADTVRRWCALRSEYVQVQQRLRSARERRDELAIRVTQMPGDSPELLKATVDELRDGLSEVEERVRRLEGEREEAIRIQTRITEAKRGHAVEDALVELERCKSELREARERDTRGAVANVLLDFVKQSARDQHLPAVFHRARSLFAAITHGRYRLDLAQGDEPAFRAFDTRMEVGHSLDELSSATRIQLLLAVRLAFVELQEGGVHLPLLLDETLGNSDDHRAGAIMEAVLELAANGRQVFYFTAQPAEVAKWQGMLASRADVPGRIIDLAEVRRLARHVRLDGLTLVSPPQVQVPPPEGRDHPEYGEMLQVPGIDPDTPLGDVHLWYLLEEPETLYHLLQDLRVESWGALRTLHDNGGDRLVDPAVYGQVKALSQALEIALELRRVGRGRPVDRAVLSASGAVSEVFLDRVDEVCRALGGDARQLVEALENGEVARFRQSNTEALRAYLEEHGYLDTREPLEDEVVRSRTLARVSEAISEGGVQIDAVDRLLSRVEIAMNEPVGMASL